MPTGVRDFFESAETVTLPARASVFQQGDECKTFYALRSGSVRVFARSPEGKEIILYRVGQSEMCTLTTSCLLSGSRYPADAVTETEVTAIAIPKTEFDQMIHRSEAFRTFVLSDFSDRLTALIVRIEQVALESIEIRLARFLLENADPQNIVTGTHQAIAQEIGSAREVVTRQLRAFADQGWIDVKRGLVTLQNRDALQYLTKVNRATH